MAFRGGLRGLWICFLLFSIGTCVPVKRGQTGTGYGFGTGSGYTRDGFAPGVGAGSGYTSGGSDSSDGGAGSSYTSGGAGSSYTSGGAGVGFGAGSNADVYNLQDEEIAQMIADLMRMRPSHTFPRFPWTSDHVPFGSVDEHLLYPSSHVVRSNSGYQRARDFRSDAKYTKETFDNIPYSGKDQESDSLESKELKWAQ